MLKTLFLGLFLLHLNYTYSQSVSTKMGARSNSIGHATAPVFDCWGIFNNVAGTAKVESLSFGFTQSINPTLPGSSRSALFTSTKIKPGVISAGVFRFGDNIYNEQLLALGFANKIGIASLGARANYIQYSIEGFGNKKILNIDFGGIVEFTPTLQFGAYITNLNQSKVNKESKEYTPTLLNAGIGFKPSPSILVITEIEKDLEYKPTWKAGAEYQIHKKVTARTGYNVNPNAAFFGFGFISSKFRIDYAYQHSFTLGASHQATISYQKKTP